MEFHKARDFNLRTFIRNTFNPCSQYNYIFLDAGWNEATKKGGLGFAIISSKRVFLLAGCKCMEADSILKAELMALDFGLEATRRWSDNIHTIFTDCLEVKVSVTDFDGAIFWRET